ncbi:MAG TPA: bifunctional 5,10-methylenetetrahydrofolate dehydrogenase/5,10-methenyltetrahydrofolate cyclohydrolase [Bdellovibrionota bacterium]|nr:bifunctional 5,10-methylenetetrahydrofolate dehydrogenase/5,10-methenyltetrahydrofolate cyclohydrolase [Bdellovibrionota bacterium]
MQKLLAKPVVERLHEDTARRARAVLDKAGRRPKLAVVLVGDDPASVIYTSKKGEAATRAGLEHETLKFSAGASPIEVKAAVERLNHDESIDGILIQRPLPRTFSEEEVLYWVSPEKDVDAFHPENAGRMLLGLPCFRPCTPAGVMEILSFYGIDPAGKMACVIGRSSIVGKPMAALLLQADATVIQAHSRTRDLQTVTRQADILVVAAGKPGLIGAEHVREKAVVIDVGIHRAEGGKVIGDVRFDEASRKASAITPVPGGVGPMTIAILLQNTVFAAESRNGLRPGLRS